MAICDTTFCELRVKDVINICDCRKLGRIIDIVIDLKCGKIKGLILPGTRTFNIFKQPEDIYIPWKNIIRIGNDVILIEIKTRIPKGCGKKGECDKDGNILPDNLFEAKVRPKILKYLDEKDENDDDDDDDNDKDD